MAYLLKTVKDELQKFDDAILLFDKILLRQPNHIPSLLHKGICLLNLGINKDANNYFDKILSVNPNHVNALGYRGILEAKTKIMILQLIILILY